MPFDVTPAHQAIFDTVKNKDSNAIIEAVAGAGKTSTIVEACKLIPKHDSGLFLAFNKSIQLELDRRLPRSMAAKTLNALGHAAWGGYVRQTHPKARLDVDADKSYKLWKKMGDEGITGRPEQRLAGGVLRLVALAKSFGVVPDDSPREGLLPDTEDTWSWFAEHFSLDLPKKVGRLSDPRQIEQRAIELARYLLAEGLEMPTRIDYNDQLYLPFVFDARPPRYDRVFIDEAQDLSPLQHSLCERVLDPTGQLVAVGDPAQAIYAFRGADSQSMVTLAERFGCKKLPLHVSYRCPKDVIALAQEVVDHIQPHPGAPQGVVDTTVHNAVEDVLDQNALKPGDFVVSRTNAPAVSLVMRLLQERKPAVMLGRDIGTGLLALIKARVGTRDVGADALVAEIDTWEMIEVQRARERNNNMRADEVKDRADTIRALSEGARTVREVEHTIKSLFKDPRYTDENAVKFASIHKSKGLEAERVWILNPHLLPHPRASRDWEIQQENNAKYVALTRSQSELRFMRHDRGK